MINDCKILSICEMDIVAKIVRQYNSGIVSSSSVMDILKNFFKIETGNISIEIKKRLEKLITSY